MRNFTDYEKMAMLELPDSERLALSGRFDEIAGGFSELDGYNVSGIEPLVSVLDLHNVLREDTAMKSFSREEILNNAPEQHEGYFQVPAAID